MGLRREWGMRVWGEWGSGAVGVAEWGSAWGVGGSSYYPVKPQPRERAWENQREKKTLSTWTLSPHL